MIFENYIFYKANLRGAFFINCSFINCSFIGSNMITINIVDSLFKKCLFEKNQIRYPSLSNVNFINNKNIDNHLVEADEFLIN
ncbi:pentapeptide repeat-containing protein [Acinetobacter sp. G11]|uniref:pentapeptide repeat-containing protein n=1 Tax=Acinetobacter sp. G11 TaxID=3415989 RepID=UPI003C7A5ED5